MNQRRAAIGSAALAAVLAAGACAEQEAPSGTKAPSGPILEAAAAARLEAMSGTLAAAPSFSFSVVDRSERVDAAGRKAAVETTREYVVQRPDKFWMRRTRDGATAFAVYDGATLSLQGDGERVWAQVEMPPTLDQALDYAAEVYRFPMPVADLLYSDPYGSIVADDTAARIVGREFVDGSPCDHLVVETPVVDAELWIERGERALPQRLVLTYEELEGDPRSEIVFSDWDLAPAVDDGLFELTPPADYERIPMVAVLSPDEEALVRAGGDDEAANGNGPATDG